jgi:methionyl-tRNA formyltransferase
LIPFDYCGIQWKSSGCGFPLERGALVNGKIYKVTSVLMYAKDFTLKTKDKTTFSRLIECGADTEKIDFYGKCLRDYLTVSEEKFLGLG